MSISKSSLFALVSMGLIWSIAVAGDPYGSEAAPPPTDKAAAKKADEKKKKDKEKKDFPDFKEVVTDEFKEVKIFHDPNLTPYYTLYHNKKTDQLLAEIPADKLEKDFMLSSSIHAAPGIAGWMWGDQILRWERRNKKLLLIEPDWHLSGS